MADTGDYLIWSHKHSGWWAPQERGYTRSLREAGRYSRERALQICAKSAAGAAEATGALPSLPVRLADVEAFTNGYLAAFAQLTDEPWE